MKENGSGFFYSAKIGDFCPARNGHFCPALTNIIRYLKTCSDDEYEALYKRARKHLDTLPRQEKIYAKQALDEMIHQSKMKADDETSLFSTKSFVQNESNTIFSRLNKRK